MESEGPKTEGLDASYKELPTDDVNKILFKDVCDAFGGIGRRRGKKKKLALIFTPQFRRLQRRESMYPLIRLIIPNCDRERPNYGVQAATLANIFILALGWVPSNPAAIRLKNFKDPKAANEMCTSSGDFPVVLKNVLRYKGFDTSPNSGLTVGEVNSLLNELNGMNKDADRAKVVNKFLQSMGARDLYWIARIVLKEMKMGLRHENVLKTFHPDAESHFNTFTDLRRLCSELSDPNIRVVPEIELFQPISPMLAQRTGVHKKVTSKMGEFIIEEKFDGERALIHYDSTIGKVMYFSRNKFNFSELFCPSIIPTIEKAVKAKRCILDGELLAWDGKAKSYIAFGSLRTVAKEVKSCLASGKSIESNGRWLKLIIFDIPYLEDDMFPNGSLMGYPLKTRLEHLNRVIPTNIPGFIQRSRGIVVTNELNPEEKLVVIKRRIDDAIKHRKEGIMVKELDSHYILGRSESWLKIKPDYIDGLRDDIDLILLGGYYGEGWRRAGAISSFLVGVEAKDKNGGPSRYLTIGKVGTGYSMRSLSVLRERLENKWINYDKRTPPLHLRGWNPGKEETPDFAILPEDSVIMTVNAAEIVQSDKFSSGYYLRFPRAVKLWRDDKSWDECMTFKELQIFVEENKGSLHGKRKAMNLSPESFLGKKRLTPSKSRVVKGDVVPQFRPTDLSKVCVQSSLFHEYDFHVVTGKIADPIEIRLSSGFTLKLSSHEDVDKLLKRYGARNLFRVMPKGFQGFIIATSTVKSSLRNTNLISYRKDILLPGWIIDCIKAGRVIKPEFSHYFSMSKETRLQMKEIDRFRDHYYQLATPLTLSDSMARARILVQTGKVKPVNISLDPLLESVPMNCFHGCKIYFDVFPEILTVPYDRSERNNPHLRFVRLLALIHGGCDSPYISSETTHIVCSDDIDEYRCSKIYDTISSLKGKVPRVVRSSWVQECIEKKKQWQEVSSQLHLIGLNKSVE